MNDDDGMEDLGEFVTAVILALVVCLILLALAL